MESNLLKESIADAKALRQTALANARIALEEAFSERYQAMFAEKLKEEAEQDESSVPSNRSEEEESMGTEENISEQEIDELIKELESEVGSEENPEANVDSPVGPPEDVTTKPPADNPEDGEDQYAGLHPAMCRDIPTGAPFPPTSGPGMEVAPVAPPGEEVAPVAPPGEEVAPEAPSGEEVAPEAGEGEEVAPTNPEEEEEEEDVDLNELLESLREEIEDDEKEEESEQLDEKKKVKKFLQKGINKSHEDYCTPMTKKTCTPHRKALAKRLKPGGDLYKKIHGKKNVDEGYEEEEEQEEGRLDERDLWMKKAFAHHHGKCTPLSKPGCTGHARALAIRAKKGDIHRDNLNKEEMEECEQLDEVTTLSSSGIGGGRAGGSPNRRPTAASSSTSRLENGSLPEDGFPSVDNTEIKNPDTVNRPNRGAHATKDNLSTPSMGGGNAPVGHGGSGIEGDGIPSVDDTVINDPSTVSRPNRSPNATKDNLSTPGGMLKENHRLRKQLTDAEEVIRYIRGQLNEVNLLNAKLLYTNKLFKEYNMNNDQKMRIVEMFDLAKNVREVKLTYANIAESLNFSGNDVSRKIKHNTNVQSITEGLASSVHGSTKPSKEIISEGKANEMVLKFQKLAGIKVPYKK